MKQNKTPTRRLGTRAAGAVLGWAGMSLAGSAAAAVQWHSPDYDNAASSDHYVAKADDRGPLAEAFDYVAHNSYFRVGVLHFQYYGTSSELKIENATGLAAQAFGPGESTLDHTGSSVGNLTTLGGTIGLYLPKTGHHLAVEVALAPPLELDFQVSGDAIDKSLAPTVLNGANGQPIPTGVPALGRNLGTVKALPPNFTLVYRPWVDTLIEPYIGVGAMYLYTYDTDINNKVLDSVKESQLYLSKPVACVGQLGADFNLPQNMFITADVKYVGCAEVKARINDVQVNSPTLSPTFGPVDVGAVSSTNQFKAVLYQFSFGMRF